MKKPGNAALKFIIFLSIGVCLLWFIYKDINLDQVRLILQGDFQYGWVLFAMVLVLVSHYIRAVRWKLLLGSIGENPSTTNTFLAVLIGYIANLAFPRMGEIARCGVLKKHEGISFAKLIGTVVLERAVDMMVLIVFTVVALATQIGVFSRFLAAHPEVLNNIKNLYSSRFFYLAIMVFLLIVGILYSILRKKSAYQKITHIVKDILQGVLSIVHMEKKGEFVFHSILIWLLYFLATYVCFFAFAFTSHLGLFAGLFVFVLGSYGMLAPVQGGLGPWHVMTIAALMIYGVPETPSATFALVVHSSTMFLTIVGGFFAFIALPFVNLRKTDRPSRY